MEIDLMLDDLDRLPDGSLSQAEVRWLTAEVRRLRSAELVGFVGAVWDDAWQVDDKFIPGEDQAVIESGGVRWAYEPGLWYLRHEDGVNDLIDPQPVYRLASGQEVADGDA